jgi:hypothetical protein
MNLTEQGVFERIRDWLGSDYPVDDITGLMQAMASVDTLIHDGEYFAIDGEKTIWTEGDQNHDVATVLVFKD